MQANSTKAPAAIRVDLAAIFVSLELSRSKWLVTSLSPGGGERMSRHIVPGGDITGLLDHFAQLQRRTEVRTGQSFRIISVQEAGLDGFWIHRVPRTRRRRELRRRPSIHCHLTPPPPGKDRQDRWRGTGSGFAGLLPRRTARLCHVACPNAGGGGPSPFGARAKGADKRAYQARQQGEGPAVQPRCIRV